MENGCILFLGNGCNNNCLMCSIGNLEVSEEVDLPELISKMEDQSETYPNISFTGGEPTEHSKILELVKKADDIGFEKIHLSSNGVNFSDKEFTDKMVENGLTEVNISLHGPKEIHNKITQEESYQKVVKGIKNLRSHDIHITIDSVLMSYNIDRLNEVWTLAKKFEIRKIGIVDLVMEGNIRETGIEKLAVPFTKKKEFFQENIEEFKGRTVFKATNFPRCVLPAKLPRGLAHISTYKKEKDWGWDEDMNRNKEHPSKRHISICEECPVKERCYGFRKENIEIFGEENIHEMLEKDSFINTSKN